MLALVLGKGPKEPDSEMKMIMQEGLRGLNSRTSLLTKEEGTTRQTKSKVHLQQRPMWSSGAEMAIQMS